VDHGHGEILAFQDLGIRFAKSSSTDTWMKVKGEDKAR
jgi:hypothetical protein